MQNSEIQGFSLKHDVMAKVMVQASSDGDDWRDDTSIMRVDA